VNLLVVAEPRPVTLAGAGRRNVALRHERLWDWRDSALTRELREGMKAREFSIVP